jgi:hypothetical protein
VHGSDANAAGERQRGAQRVSGPITPEEREVVARQLGRPPRALRAVAHRCPCGQPDVVQTSPRLEDGTPFPTLYYLTCPRASAAASRLESTGRMREWQADLGTDPELAAGYRAAHEAYLAERDALGELPTRNTAGGMPDRVKCLHALAAHALAAGPGVNPVGDRAVAEMGEWWANGPCARTAEDDGRASIAGSAGDRGADRGRSRATDEEGR